MVLIRLNKSEIPSITNFKPVIAVQLYKRLLEHIYPVIADLAKKR